MKTLLLGTTLAALALGTLPAAASEFGAGTYLAGAAAFADPTLGDDVFDRRGRGRGRGGDDDRHGGNDDDDDDRRGRGGDDDRHGADDDDDNRRGGHGGRPRIPGGSGCDDPGDVLEHPECRV